MKSHMRSIKEGFMRKILSFALFLLLPLVARAQRPEHTPDEPVEKWTGKTIMLIGAHADDDFGKWSDQSAGEAGKRGTRAKGDCEDSLGVDAKQLSDFTILNDGAQIKPECRSAQNNHDRADDDDRTCDKKNPIGRISDAKRLKGANDRAVHQARSGTECELHAVL